MKIIKKLLCAAAAYFLGGLASLILTILGLTFISFCLSIFAAYDFSWADWFQSNYTYISNLGAVIAVILLFTYSPRCVE